MSLPRCREKKESQPHFICYCKLFKITLDFIQWTNQSELLFSYPFQNYSKNRDGVHLKILPTLSSEIIFLNWAKKNICGGLELLFKSRLLPSKKVSFYLLPWKPFKDDEKCFLFHIKSSFRSQDILTFVLKFRSYRRNDLIRKIRLISKIMTS